MASSDPADIDRAADRVVEALAKMPADQAQADALSDLRDVRAEVVALRAELAKAREANRLPDDTVCACLSETGERKVEIVERCLRCGSLMYSDAYHDEREAREAAEERAEKWRRMLADETGLTEQQRARAEEAERLYDEAEQRVTTMEQRAEAAERELAEAKAHIESQDWYSEWYEPMKRRAEAAERDFAIKDRALTDYFADAEKRAEAAEEREKQLREALERIEAGGVSAWELRKIAAAALGSASAADWGDRCVCGRVHDRHRPAADYTGWWDVPAADIAEQADEPTEDTDGTAVTAPSTDAAYEKRREEWIDRLTRAFGFVPLGLYDEVTKLAEYAIGEMLGEIDRARAEADRG